MPNTSISRALLPLLAVAIFAATPSGAQAQLKHGDVNGDGIVSALDAQAILTSVVSLPLPAGYVVANGDSNCDNTTGALDAQIVLSYVIGLDVSQHCVGQAFGPGAITMTLTPTDTSVLINRGLRFRAILKDSAGATPVRPVTWSTSNADLIAVDSSRGDTAWVSNKGAAHSAVATLTATADGVSKSTTIRVYRTYAGIVITPQKPDTLRQLNQTYNFIAKTRDSLGVVTQSATSGFWTVADTAIASVPSTAASTGVVTAKNPGATWLRVASGTNSSDKDSVRIIVAPPVLNACTGDGGVRHTEATFTTPQTWTPANNPHYLAGGLTFNSGSSLTIQPGVLVCANYGVAMLFKQGSRLTAVGTATQPIRFTTTDPEGWWYGIQFGDANSYVTTPLADTSRLTNVRFERGSDGDGVIDGRQQHVVLLDSVHIRQTYYGAVQLLSPGSRMIRSTVDSSSYDYPYYYAVSLGRASLEESTIRIGNTSSGIYVSEAATIRQVTITGGTTAISQDASGDSARINDVTITGTKGTALVLNGGLIHPASGNVSVTGGTGGVFRGGIGNFAHLFPDSAAQGSLKNNGRDTVDLYYGVLVNRTLSLRPDLAWKLEGTVQIDTLAQLVLRPGTTLGFDYGGLYFHGGGTLDARGTATQPIRFRPVDGAFYGLEFNNPGQGSSPFATAPVAESRLVNVRLDSASGVCCAQGYASIVGENRHRLIIDSALVRLSQYGGVHLQARGSSISRSVIDTTGTPTTSYPALALGDSTTAEDVTVRRSGHVGVMASGTGARLRSVRVLNSVSYGVDADEGIIRGDSGAVTMEGNAYPGRFRIENLAILAPDSAAQRALFSSTTVDSVVVVVTGSLTRDTITAIPQLRWQLEGTVNIDTLGHFAPRPGARISGYYGGLYFRQGGTINARGTATRPIRFYPAASNANFYGLELANPGQGTSPFSSAPVAQSFLVNVRIDSASGQCCVSSFGYAAVSAADRHRVTIDSSVIRMSQNGAVHLGARGSRISRSVIDTTGTPTTSYVALGLSDSTTADSVTVRRSGYIGVNASGAGARLRKVEILNSVQHGLHAVNNLLLGDSGSVTMQGNAYAGRVLIQNLGLLAPDSASQRAWYSSSTTDSAIVITGGNLVADTVTAIPQLRWQVEGSVTFDTLSLFRPRPGARIGGYNGGLYFRQGATIDARGTATRPIRFYPVASNVNFYGLELENAGAGSNPFSTAPRDTSFLVNVQIDSASGQCCVSGFGYAAVSANNRHIVVMDSARVRKAHNGAVHLAARGSSIKRTVIDTTGLPTASYPAVGLGDSVTVDSLVVRRSGQVGVRATGSWVRLQRLHVLNSVDYGLYGESGVFVGDSAGATLSGNAYPARLRLENVALLMADSVSQARAVGNVTDVLVVTASTLTNDTVTAIPQLRWQVEGNPTFGSGTQFRPRPGARITGYNSSLDFDNGGSIYAVGTATDTIRFYPAASNVNFYGIWLDNPATGRDTSIFQYVRVDSASGVCCATSGFGGYASIMAGSNHVVQISNARFRKNQASAVSLRGIRSSLTKVFVDTTGTGAALTNSYTAVVVGDSAQLDSVIVRRSGFVGIWLEGRGISLADVRAVGSVGDGIVLNTDHATYQGATGVTTRLVTADSNGGNGFSVRVSDVTLRYCSARGNGSHGVTTTTTLDSVYVNNCDFITNAGNGVNNLYTGTSLTFFVNAENNYWGAAGGPEVANGGDGKSATVTATTWCTAGTCTVPAFLPYQGVPSTPAIPPREYVQRGRRAARRTRRT